MRLPRWTPPGELSDDPAKLYWIDPGLLHAMLGWSDDIFENKIAGLSAGQPTPERDKQILHNSWEGFVITSLVRCAGNSARPAVWRSPTGEIDLILTWLGGEDVWAIEVTMGKRKDLASLWAGRNETHANRAFLVYQQSVGRPDLQGVDQYGPLHRLTLNDALAEVLAMAGQY